MSVPSQVDQLVSLIAQRAGQELTAARYPYVQPVNLLHFFGQSLSLGLGTSGTLSGASPFYNAKMPSNGVQDATWVGGNDGIGGTASLSASLVQLDGSVNAHGLEPPVIGAVNQLASMVDCADIMGADAGKGGYGVIGMKKGYNGGVGPYALLVNQFQTYNSFSKPVTPVLCWMQGESDANNAPITTPANDRSSYKAAVRSIINDYSADSGRSVHFFTYQLSSHTMRSPGYNYNIGLALAELGEDFTDVSVVTPMYPFNYSDGVHLTSESSRLVGCYFGKAAEHYYRTGTKFEPLKPISVARAGKVITITFNVPVGNLVYDSTIVNDPGYMGFEVFLQSSGANLLISRTYIYGNKAAIELVNVPSGNVEVGYALGTQLNGQNAGRVTGARGCLRDESDVRAYYDPAVILRNWCVMFRKPEGFGL